MKDMIVVCGMARSGTSILTALLGTHPEVLLITDEHNGFSECDLVYPQFQPGNWPERIRALRAEHPDKHLLMKRPWIEKMGRSWWERMEPVRVAASIKKPYDRQKASWDKHKNDRKKGKKVYDKHYCLLNTFEQRTGIRMNAFRMDEAEHCDIVRQLGLNMELSDDFDAGILERPSGEIDKGEYKEKYGLLEI